MQTWAPVDVPHLQGSGPPLRLHDTATGEVRATAPGPTALMYVCGITPYDATHLGHAATYLAFDLVNRYWRDLGHDVAYVQNITDIDDPLLERAARDQDDWVVLGMRETALFREDMEALRVAPPRHYIGAVEAMGEIAELVGKLLAEGAAYRVDDPQFPDVYFDSAATGHFGYECRYDEETMIRLSRERGGDPDRPGKRHPTDALLWRMAREGEPSWETRPRTGASGLARRVCRDRAEPARPAVRPQRRRLGPDLPAPRVRRGARRGAHRRPSLREALRARRDDRAGRREDEQEPRQPGVRLQAAQPRRRPERDPPGPARRALPQRPAVDGGPAHRAQERLATWRCAAARDTGPDGAVLVAALRDRLADDLDTPGALAAVDTWAAGGAATRRRRGWSATRWTPCSASRCQGCSDGSWLAGSGGHDPRYGCPRR